MPGFLSSNDSNQPKILDEVRQYLRLHHYSIHTERSYLEANKALQQMRGALAVMANTRQLAVLFWYRMNGHHPAGMRLRAGIGMVADG